MTRRSFRFLGAEIPIIENLRARMAIFSAGDVVWDGLDERVPGEGQRCFPIE